MKSVFVQFYLLMLMALFPPVLHAAFGLVPQAKPIRLRSGGESGFVATITNDAKGTIGAMTLIKVYQASSATTLPIATWPWKKIEMFPSQTVLEPVTVPLPAVRAETLFILQFITDAGTVFGTLEVRAYPTNLLKELNCTNELRVGVYDPGNELKALLTSQGVTYYDIETHGPGAFAGKLAFIVPLPRIDSLTPETAATIRLLAKRGVAIVCIINSETGAKRIEPTFYFVRKWAGPVLVARHELIANLPGEVESQLNLIKLAELAMHPDNLQVLNFNDAN